MSNSFRLGAVAIFLAALAVITSQNIWGQPGQAKGKLLPADAKRSADNQARDPETALAQSKFDAGGIMTYKTLQGEELFSWQLKVDLGASAVRPRDVLIMISTTASEAGVNFIASQQLAEEMMKKAAPGDRFSLWMVSTNDEVFTKNLTKNFINPQKEEKQVAAAMKVLGTQYPAGDCDLKSALAKAIETFEPNDDRQQVLLYIGDGQSNAAPINAADRAALSKRMIDRKIAFFPVPLGIKLDPTNLHGLATGTGGLVVRVALLKDKAPEAVARIQQTLAAPIFYPTAAQMPAEVIEFFPARLPPLRSDAPTLIVGKMNSAKQLTATIEGFVGGKPAKFVAKVTDNVPEAEMDNYFLVSMVDQWRNAKDQPALIRADRALAMAHTATRFALDGLLGDAQMAMQQKDFDAASLLYLKAFKLAPHDPEAREALKLIEGLKNGKIDRVALEKQLDKSNRKLADLSARMSLDEITKLTKKADAQPPAQPSPADQARAEQDALKAYRDHVAIQEQALKQQIEADLKTALKELRKDPDAAHERVRSALLRVKDYPDLSDPVRDSLLKMLESGLRTVATEGAQAKLRLIQEQAAVSLALERKETTMLQKTEMDRMESRLRMYKNLLNEARYDLIQRQQATTDILEGMLKIQEDAKVQGRPSPAAAQGMYVAALTSYNLQMEKDIRVQTERNFLAIMLEVEKSHIPLPDEPPVHYMTRLPVSQRVRAWKILSDRRKYLYENSDFFSDPKTRSEADKLAELLEKVIDTTGLQQEQSIKEALGLIQARLSPGGEKGDMLPILIDTQAFLTETPDAYTSVDAFYEAKVKFPPFPNKMAIRTALRIILSSLPSKNATYVIRPKYIEVTTNKLQYAEKALRVYPVGDLVIPISSSTNPFANGTTPGGAGGALGAIGGAFGAGGGMAMGGFPAGGGFGAGGFQGGGFGAAGFQGGGFGAGFPAGGGFGAGIGAGFPAGGGFGAGVGAGFPAGGGFGAGIGAGFPAGGGFGAGAAGALGSGQGFPGASIPGQNCLGFNQFNGGLGAFGTGGLDQGLILLIRQVVAPGEWGTQNCRLQYSGTPGFGGGGGIPGIGAGATTVAGTPGFPGAPGAVDPKDANNIAFYPTSLALVVQGTARKHYKEGGVLGGKGGGAGGALALEDFLKKPGVERVDGKGGKAEVAGGKNRQADGPDGPGKGNQAVAEFDAKQIWQDALTKGVQNPGLVLAAADFLFDEGLYDHAAEFLKANLRNGILVEPWVYEALALAMEFDGSASPEEIQRARLSAISLNPKDAGSYVKAAQACADHKQFDKALAFCKQAAQLEPGLSNAYTEALAFAEKAKDIKGMEWAVTKVVSQDWPGDNQTLQLKANKNLDKLVQSLQSDKRGDEADRLQASIKKLKQRDLVINMTWQPGASGDADLELQIKEPTGTICSSQYRTTPGGGTLSGLTLDSQRKASYAASQAFSGEYQIDVKRLWGQPAAGRFRLEIIQHQGTPDEKRRVETFAIDQKFSMKIVLANGRRTEMAPTLAVMPRQSKDETVQTETVLAKLRNIADPVGEQLPRGVAGAINKYRVNPVAVAPPSTKLKDQQKEQLVYQGGTGSGASGVYLTSQGHLSADGQYLRLSVNPVFQPGLMGSGRMQVEMPLIPGARD